MCVCVRVRFCIPTVTKAYIYKVRGQLFIYLFICFALPCILIAASSPSLTPSLSHRYQPSMAYQIAAGLGASSTEAIGVSLVREKGSKGRQ